MADKIVVIFSNFAPFFIRFMLPNGEVREYLRHDIIGNEDLLVAAVAQHAQDNYAKDGWDNVVECFGREEIARIIIAAGARTIHDAIKAVGRAIGIVDERRKDALGHGGLCTICHSADHLTQTHRA